MNKFLTNACLIVFLSFSMVYGQGLSETEQKLADYARFFLTGKSLEEKIEINKNFSQLLIETLKKPESYSYPFSTLKSISILSAADDAFRVFTWQLVDSLENKEGYPEQYYYYFGLVQRKYVETNGATSYLVIPLIELPKHGTDLENRILDNNSWLGGLYYPSRLDDKIPVYTIKYLDTTREPKEATQKCYLLFGYNALDHLQNMKFAEVLTFDKNNKDRVLFGANIFYYDIVPKTRAILQYSDNAPLTLNMSYVKSGLFRKKMIVYDHLAVGKGRGPFGGVGGMGPDGSYDGLYFYKRRGYFEWYRNVVIAEKYNKSVTPKQQMKAKQKEIERLKTEGVKIN